MTKSNSRSGDNQGTVRDKIIIRILAAVFLVGGFQVATQYFAHQFNYQAQLGTHFNYIYAPWAILVWADQWYDQFPNSFDLAAGIGILFSSIGLILVLVIKMVLANSSRVHQKLHGSARWADKKDIQAAGLLATDKT